jgi:hypothetical protein
MVVSIAQISDIVKMVGLVAGGLWVAWTFHKLQKVRAAELENNQRLTAIQKSRVEQEEIGTRLLRQQPQLAIQLNVTETVSPTETCKSFLCVTVVLKNEGERNLQIDFDTSALTVGRRVFEKDGKVTIDVKRYGPSYFTPDNNAPQFLPSRILRAGQQRQMAFAILPVTEPGGYIVQFNALYYKIPFEGEEPSAEAPFIIDAMEQTIYFATGKPHKPASTA